MPLMQQKTSTDLNTFKYADPAEPTFTFKLKLSENAKGAGTYTVANYRTSLTTNYVADITPVAGGDTVSENLSVKVVLSGSALSKQKLLDMLGHSRQQLLDWINTDGAEVLAGSIPPGPPDTIVFTP